MQYRDHSDTGTKFYAVRYKLLEPATFRIRLADGRVETRSYGIGESLWVMKPSGVIPLVCSEPLDEIPLSDGSVIIEYPADIRTERQWS